MLGPEVFGVFQILKYLHRFYLLNSKLKLKNAELGAM